MVKAVLTSQVSVNALDKGGKTALDYVADYGHVNIIMELVSVGGKITTKSNEIWVKKIVSDHKDYGLYYWGLMLIPRVALLLVSTFVGFALCERFGFAVYMKSVWQCYAIITITRGLTLLYKGMSLFLAIPVAWLWGSAYIESRGLLLLFSAYAIPVALIAIGFGYPQGRANSQFRSKTSSYMLTDL